jgi:23S rRNA pseudouridine2605 synthase
VKRGQMLKLDQKTVVGLLEWAGLAVPNAPLKQLSQREKDKASSVFMPKVRKQRPSVLDRVPRAEGEPYAHKPAAPRKATDSKKPGPKKSANRRVRQTSDLNPPAMQKKSDRNRGRG